MKSADFKAVMKDPKHLEVMRRRRARRRKHMVSLGVQAVGAIPVYWLTFFNDFTYTSSHPLDGLIIVGIYHLLAFLFHYLVSLEYPTPSAFTKYYRGV